MLRLRDALPPDVPIGPGEDPGHLVPAAALLNGASITRDSAPAAWYTLDLGAPTILLAAGTALASARLAAAGAPRPGPGIPILPPGARLNAHRRRLADRARAAGLAPQPAPPPRLRPPPPPESGPPPPPLAVFAAGGALPLEETAPLAFACTLPALTGPIRLRATPRRAADPADGRRFGVCLAAVRLDGALLGFDAPCFGPGFHPPSRTKALPGAGPPTTPGSSFPTAPRPAPSPSCSTPGTPPWPRRSAAGPAASAQTKGAGGSLRRPSLSPPEAAGYWSMVPT
jgi:hypothetical protein